MNRLNEQSMQERVEALREPNAEALLNGRCVGRTEYDPKAGTVLVMTWHDPTGCEHPQPAQMCKRCGVGPFFRVEERPYPALYMDCAELVTPSASTVRRLRAV